MGKRMSDGDEKISVEAAAEYERQRRIREVEERAAAFLAKHPQMAAQAAAWNDVQTVQAMAQAHQLQVPRLPFRPAPVLGAPAGAGVELNRLSRRCWQNVPWQALQNGQRESGMLH